MYRWGILKPQHIKQKLLASLDTTLLSVGELNFLKLF